jgi:hypothetical protein
VVSATLFILVLCWIAVGVSFLLPLFRNSRQFGSIDALRRLRGEKGPLAELPGHDHIGEPHIATPPHGELAPRYSDAALRPTPSGTRLLTLPEQELVVATTDNATYFDPWTQQYVNEHGEAANVPTTAQQEMNVRATAYSRPLVAGQRPATQPISGQRRAAQRRREVLRWMAIAIASTTVPAVLTSWTFFVTLSVMSWLAFAAWFSLMLYFMNAQEQIIPTGARRTRTTPVPDNIVPLRRREAPAAEEEFEPAVGSGFARAQYAVGE